jgi:hypothetical protein
MHYDNEQNTNINNHIHMTVDRIKPLTPYFNSIVTIAIAVASGWGAMNFRMYETESKIKVIELQLKEGRQQSAIDEKRQDDKLETLQNAYINTVQSVAIINTKLDMILDKKKP